MPSNFNPTTFTSPIETSIDEPFLPVSPIPTPELAIAYPRTEQHTQTQQPAPEVILLPETGAGLDGLVFSVVFVGGCFLAAKLGKWIKRRL